jgi:quercetin dioxygenase-like cupin family protein
MGDIPFQKIDWTSIERVAHEGESGAAFWQTIEFGGSELRIRIVEYSKGYLADHWCEKGHIVHCLDGEFTTELGTDEKINVTKGQTYVVSDQLSLHRTASENGVKLLIIDGDFLK